MSKFVTYSGDSVNILSEFPIGYILITTVNTNPATFTIGKWEYFGQGKTLVGLDSTQTEFNTVLKTGGEKAHTLTSNEMPSHTHVQNGHTHYGTTNEAGNHNHSAWTNEAGNHNHSAYIRKFNDGGSYTEIGFNDDYTGSANNIIQYAGNHTHGVGINANGNHYHKFTSDSSTATNQNTGGSSSHNNLPPYITVYMWKRIS